MEAVAMKCLRVIALLSLISTGFGLSGQTHAAEGWKMRFPLSGTLGGEMVAPIQTGWFGSAVVTQLEISGVNGNDGEALTRDVSGSVTRNIGGVNRTATYEGTATVDMSQSLTLSNLIFGHVSEGTVAGGNLSFLANIPYGIRSSRSTAISGPVPTLTPFEPYAGDVVQAIGQGLFATQIRDRAAAASEDASGVVTGFGDAEFTAGWVYTRDKPWTPDALKVIAGLTIVAPTGEYDKDRTRGNIGFGNFYTVRLGGALAYSFQDNLTLGARASIASNSRNKDNDWRSGNYGTLDMAAAYKSAYGVFGPHVLAMYQYQDDSGGANGASRFKSISVGAFYAVPIKAYDAGLNIAYMKTIEAKNAFELESYQIRFSKSF